MSNTTRLTKRDLFGSDSDSGEETRMAETPEGNREVSENEDSGADLARDEDGINYAPTPPKSEVEILEVKPAVPTMHELMARTITVCLKAAAISNNFRSLITPNHYHQLPIFSVKDKPVILRCVAQHNYLLHIHGLLKDNDMITKEKNLDNKLVHAVTSKNLSREQMEKFLGAARELDYFLPQDENMGEYWEHSSTKQMAILWETAEAVELAAIFKDIDAWSGNDSTRKEVRQEIPEEWLITMQEPKSNKRTPKKKQGRGVNLILVEDFDGWKYCDILAQAQRDEGELARVKQQLTEEAEKNEILKRELATERDEFVNRTVSFEEEAATMRAFYSQDAQTKRVADMARELAREKEVADNAKEGTRQAQLKAQQVTEQLNRKEVIHKNELERKEAEIDALMEENAAIKDECEKKDDALGKARRRMDDMNTEFKTTREELSQLKARTTHGMAELLKVANEYFGTGTLSASTPKRARKD